MSWTACPADNLLSTVGAVAQTRAPLASRPLNVSWTPEALCGIPGCGGKGACCATNRQWPPSLGDPSFPGLPFKGKKVGR